MDTVDGPPREELPPLPSQRDWPSRWMQPFLQALSAIPEVTDACRVARISRSGAYAARERNAEFSAAWDEAIEIAHSFVQRMAHQWITTGVPVRSVRRHTTRKLDPEGNVLEQTVEEWETEGSERSAMLMKFWLQSWRPERYRWSERVDVSGPGGGPIPVESLTRIDQQIQQLADELAQRAGAEPVPVEE